MKPWLIVCDLDGTLLDTPKRLSPEYVNKLNSLIEEGLHFTIATGRDMRNTKKAIDGLTIKYPAILTNGALLADLNTETYLKVTHIENAIAQEILELAEDLNIFPIVFAAYEEERKQMHFLTGKWGKKYNPPILLEKGQYVPLLNELIVSMQFHDKKERLDELKEKIHLNFGDKVNLIYIEDVSYGYYGIPGKWYWLEINSADAGKDKMLKYLAEYLSWDLENIAVFGDNLNDIDILKIAGKAIVVENAPEEVKQVADDICPPNTEGGVIKYLLEHKKEFISLSEF